MPKHQTRKAAVKVPARPASRGSAEQTVQAVPVMQSDRHLAPLSYEDQLLSFGVSGLNRIGNYIFEEFLKELQGQKGYKLLREMRDNDPTVGSILYLMEQLGKQVDWKVEPYGGGKVEVEDEDRAEYLRTCLMDDMTKTWPETLSEIYSMFWAGFAPMEMCWKIRNGEQSDPAIASSNFNDGLWGWDHWGVRAQETILYWQFDQRNQWQAIGQQAPPDYLLRIVPREKVLLFRVKSDRDNPEGRSLLRNAVTSWMKKKRLEQIEAVGIERRISGFPVLTPPEGLDLWNTKDPNASSKLTEAKKLVRNVRMDEQMGMVKPFGWDFQLLSAQGGSSAMDTNAVINRYDTRILMTVAMDFLMLGQAGQAGARSQATADIDLFATAFDGVLDAVVEVPNRNAFPKLFKFNGWDTNRLPKLTHGSIANPNIAAVGSFIVNLAQAGMELFPDQDLEHALRALAGLPEPVGGVSKQKKLGRRMKYGKSILGHVETKDDLMIGAVKKLMMVCDKIAKEA